MNASARLCFLGFRFSLGLTRRFDAVLAEFLCTTAEFLVATDHHPPQGSPSIGPTRTSRNSAAPPSTRSPTPPSVGGEGSSAPSGPCRASHHFVVFRCSFSFPSPRYRPFSQTRITSGVTSTTISRHGALLPSRGSNGTLLENGRRNGGLRSS